MAKDNREDTNFFGNRRGDKFMTRLIYDLAKLIVALGVIAGAFVAFGNTKWQGKEAAQEFETKTKKTLGSIMAEQRLQKEMSKTEFRHIKEGLQDIKRRLP